MQASKRYDIIKENICNIPQPLIYQKGACLHEEENPTNPVDVTVVCILNTDHINSDSGCQTCSYNR